MNIVLTGASKGIGKAIAEKFAKAGHSIAICSRNLKNLLAVKNELEIKYPGCSVKIYAVDMSKVDEVKKFGNGLLENGFVPDILVNNAGIFFPGSVISEEEGNLELMIETNLYSAYHLTRTLLPKMIERKSGHIFNICSIAALKAYSNGGSYSISKFAMMGFSKNLREELKPHGIKVTEVHPGATMTASWEGADINPDRIMEAKDIAEMVFAASFLSPMAVVEEIVLRPQLGDL